METEAFCVQEDGITFLSRKELDDYRDQEAQIAWQDGEHAPQ
jgi:hypothetical protein